MQKLCSPNFDDRADGQSPSYVMLHGTWTGDMGDSLVYLMEDNPPEGRSRVSAHYFIDIDGSVIQLVDEDKRAWHAGVGHWRGIDDMNSASIGIELQNSSEHLGKRAPYEDKQIDALINLLKDIQTRHNIALDNIIAHSDFAPDRKDDPGEHFPWEALAKANVAMWPDEGDAPDEIVDALHDDEAGLLNALHGWGFGSDFDAKDIITAFDRHFVPEAFDDTVTENIEALRVERIAVLWAKKLGI